jgi:hypothetical protein
MAFGIDIKRIKNEISKFLGEGTIRFGKKAGSGTWGALKRFWNENMKRY